MLDVKKWFLSTSIFKKEKSISHNPESLILTYNDKIIQSDEKLSFVFNQQNRNRLENRSNVMVFRCFDKVKVEFFDGDEDYDSIDNDVFPQSVIVSPSNVYSFLKMCFKRRHDKTRHEIDVGMCVLTT